MDFTLNNGLSMTGGDDLSDIQTQIAVLDASVVHKTGNLNESIDGQKVFTSDFGIFNDNTNIVSSVGVNIASAVNYLNGTQNRIGSSLPTASTSIGNKIDCIGGYNLMTSATTSSIANQIEATGGASNAMTTTGAGNNVLNAQGSGKNSIISQTGNNELTAGTANKMIIGSTEKLNMTSALTTLTNTAHTITATGLNTISSSLAGVANDIRASGANSYNRIQNSGSSGQNLIIATLGTNRIASNSGVSYANQLDAYGTGGNEIKTTTGDNTITTSGGNNFMTITGGSFKENILTANANSSLANRIVGFNNYLTGSDTNYVFAPKNSMTANTTNNATANLIDATGTGGGNTIRTTTGQTSITSTSGQIRIQTTSTLDDGVLVYNGGNGGGVIIRADNTNSNINLEANTTSGITNITGFNMFITMTDRFDITCLNNRQFVTGNHLFFANGNEKLSMNSTTTTMTNTTINIDATSLVALKIGGVQKIGSSSVSTTLNNQEIYITGSSLCYTEVNSKIRIYNQSDRNEYRFNPTGTSTQVWRLYDNGTANVLYCLQSTTALNGVYLPNGANGWSAWSDERIKKNIKPIDTALTDILNLKPVFYNYKGDADTQALRAGFIAQEVQQVYPDLINESSMDSGDIKNLLGLDMTNLVPYLVKAIQDLNKKVEEQSLIINDLVLKNS